MRQSMRELVEADWDKYLCVQVRIKLMKEGEVIFEGGLGKEWGGGVTNAHRNNTYYTQLQVTNFKVI